MEMADGWRWKFCIVWITRIVLQGSLVQYLPERVQLTEKLDTVQSPAGDIGNIIRMKGYRYLCLELSEHMVFEMFTECYFPTSPISYAVADINYDCMSASHDAYRVDQRFYSIKYNQVCMHFRLNKLTVHSLCALTLLHFFRLIWDS